jgi:hypothetical protein
MGVYVMELALITLLKTIAIFLICESIVFVVCELYLKLFTQIDFKKSLFDSETDNQKNAPNFIAGSLVGYIIASVHFGFYICLLAIYFAL